MIQIFYLFKIVFLYLIGSRTLCIFHISKEILIADIRIENADMSSFKQCFNHCDRKFKGFLSMLNRWELYGP
jgi:hypothetical protein